MEQRARRTGRAGFVLVGGKSSRMGRDKALLPCRRATLVEHVAGLVDMAVGNVSLVGPRDRYERFGYPVVTDLSPDRGPLGGIDAALRNSEAAWNLVVACDMPALPPDFLHSLLDEAEAAACECLIPVSPAGVEPLCAVYHRECRNEIGRALDRGVLKVHEAVAALRARYWKVREAAWFVNLNTPEDWAHYCAACEGLSPQPR
jgi:molybdopterin-guanine dinucleotide biosynthesis protein A